MSDDQNPFGFRQPLWVTMLGLALWFAIWLGVWLGVQRWIP